MFLAKVHKHITSIIKHPAYAGKKLFTVHRIDPYGKETGEEWVAVDYLGSACGNTVVCSGAPGAAGAIFHLKRAPIRTMIIAIVDSIDFRDMKDSKKAIQP